jgi:peptidoglycan/LPS O-acetylase OafA/YrhL
MALLLAVWPAGESGLEAQSVWKHAVQKVAQQSYSIFLIHFAVILLVSAIWFHAGWQDPWINLAGLCITMAISLWSGSLLYSKVESQAATGWRWLAWVMVLAISGAVAANLA